jgi:hypothetical protein
LVEQSDLLELAVEPGLLRERLALQVLLVQLHRRPPLQVLHQRQRSRLLSP